MPLERRTTGSQFRAVSIGLFVLAIAVALTLVFFQFAGKGKSSVVVSDTTDEFRVGNPVRMAKQIAADGPLLFSDVSGRGQIRPIFVAHTGSDPLDGWTAFSAKAPGSQDTQGKPSDCYVQWDRGAKKFVQKDSKGRRCGDRTFDSSGTGLTPYPIAISGKGDDAVLWVDLGAEGSTTTSTSPSSTTTAPR